LKDIINQVSRNFSNIRQKTKKPMSGAYAVKSDDDSKKPIDPKPI
jgi:hypothetical protein